MGDHLCRLSLPVKAWHRIVDVHQDAVIWDELRLPENYRRLEKFYTQVCFNIVWLERRATLRDGLFV